jgi:hypothetical protein
MIRWEYVTVSFTNVHLDGEWKLKHFFTGTDGAYKELVGENNTLVILNQLGAKGWEVVYGSVAEAGMFTGNKSNGEWYRNATPLSKSYLLKRPIS